MIDKIKKYGKRLNEAYGAKLQENLNEFYAPSQKIVIPISITAGYIGITQAMYWRTLILVAIIAFYGHIIYREEMKWRDKTTDVEISNEDGILGDGKNTKQSISKMSNELKAVFDGGENNE